jgi:hypothetical protein
MRGRGAGPLGLTWILSDPARCDDFPANPSFSQVSTEKMEIGAGEVAEAAFAPNACAAWVAPPRPTAVPAKAITVRLLSGGGEAAVGHSRFAISGLSEASTSLRPREAELQRLLLTNAPRFNGKLDGINADDAAAIKMTLAMLRIIIIHLDD